MRFVLLSALVVICVSNQDPDDPLDPSLSSEPTNDTEPIREAADDASVNVAVKDVAFYLRSHKFNEYDRRFYETPNETSRSYFVAFPDPPLRSLHWEVRKSCEPGFQECLQYLHDVILMTELRRADDTTTVARAQGWSLERNPTEVRAVDRECVRLRQLDLVGAQPFQGPLDRFQWRTTASYYMCWFTMTRVPALTLFGEPCDNFSSCLDETFGLSNGDPRADDRLSYQCAAYSFCPETCCPVRHVIALSECWELPLNPCLTESPEYNRSCSVKSADNGDLHSVILGRWNTSCACARAGFEWDARYGMCVDVDECARSSDTCNHTTQACFNLAGGFTCGCRWGFLFDPRAGQCVKGDVLLVPDTRFDEVTEREVSASLIKLVTYKLSTAAENTSPGVVVQVATTLLLASRGYPLYS